MNERTSFLAVALLLSVDAWSCAVGKPAQTGGRPFPVQPAPTEQANERPAVATARARLAKAQARVNDLETQLANAQSPPVSPPSLSPEEGLAREGLDSVQRAIHVQQQLELARLELLEAQKALTQALIGD